MTFQNMAARSTFCRQHENVSWPCSALMTTWVIKDKLRQDGLLSFNKDCIGIEGVKMGSVRIEKVRVG